MQRAGLLKKTRDSVKHEICINISDDVAFNKLFINDLVRSAFRSFSPRPVFLFAPVPVEKIKAEISSSFAEFYGALME